MDKIQLNTLHFLYLKDKTCKVSEIRLAVDFTGSNLDFLNHLFSLFPKYIIQQHDNLTITTEGKSLLLEEQTRLARVAEKDELEINELREEKFAKPQTKLYGKWQFWLFVIFSVLTIMVAIVTCNRTH